MIGGMTGASGMSLEEAGIRKSTRDTVSLSTRSKDAKVITGDGLIPVWDSIEHRRKFATADARIGATYATIIIQHTGGKRRWEYDMLYYQDKLRTDSTLKNDQQTFIAMDTHYLTVDINGFLTIRSRDGTLYTITHTFHNKELISAVKAFWKNFMQQMWMAQRRLLFAICTPHISSLPQDIIDLITERLAIRFEVPEAEPEPQPQPQPQDQDQGEAHEDEDAF